MQAVLVQTIPLRIPLESTVNYVFAGFGEAKLSSRRPFPRQRPRPCRSTPTPIARLTAERERGTTVTVSWGRLGSLPRARERNRLPRELSPVRERVLDVRQLRGHADIQQPQASGDRAAFRARYGATPSTSFRSRFRSSGRAIHGTTTAPSPPGPEPAEPGTADKDVLLAARSSQRPSRLAGAFCGEVSREHEVHQGKQEKRE